MHRIFISHPYRNNPKRNRECITAIFLTLINYNVMPISPIHMFSPLNDNEPTERELGLRFCEEMIPLCDEIWFFDEWWESEGCWREMEVARKGKSTIRVVEGWNDTRPVFWPGDEPEWWEREEKKHEN